MDRIRGRAEEMCWVIEGPHKARCSNVIVCVFPHNERYEHYLGKTTFQTNPPLY